jgi:hypothetical protein
MPAFFGVMFFLVFTTSLTIIIIGIVKSIKQWNENNNSPRLMVPATVVDKRTHVSHSHHNH